MTNIDRLIIYMKMIIHLLNEFFVCSLNIIANRQVGTEFSSLLSIRSGLNLVWEISDGRSYHTIVDVGKGALFLGSIALWNGYLFTGMGGFNLDFLESTHWHLRDDS